ncbi:MAG TPA: tetratricopeptide repeat protein [Spirochaetota bacterium]|nr:tetratricopeptide repeat protein [Spirochaetota bacterium]HPD78798.1 tetratricopeptide repeat protein [Spirochaetota bacterium]HRU65594.1 tetratricopeptide repeat protein [Spirochaetota bacterium]
MRKLIFSIVFCCLLVPLLAEEATYYNNQGLDFLRKGEPEKALSFFMSAELLDQSNKHFKNNIAVSLMRLGRYEESIVYLNKAIELDPFYVKALCNMAVAQFHLRNYKESYKYYLKALRADESYTKIRFEKTKVKKFLSSSKSISNENKGLVEKALNYLDNDN